MFSMTKSRELDEKQRQDADLNRHHYGEDVKFLSYFAPYMQTQRPNGSVMHHLISWW